MRRITERRRRTIKESNHNGWEISLRLQDEEYGGNTYVDFDIYYKGIYYSAELEGNPKRDDNEWEITLDQDLKDMLSFDEYIELSNELSQKAYLLTR